MLLLTILVEIIFIMVVITSIREENSFEDIKQKIDSNVITQDNTINKQLTNKNINIQNNIEPKDNRNNENNISKEEINTLEEYKNMPRELKGYKVIRKNNNPKAKIREFHIRRNKYKNT